MIEGRKRFGFKGDEYDIRVRTPHGSEVDANIASATFRAAGRLGAVEVNTASGRRRRSRTSSATPRSARRAATSSSGRRRQGRREHRLRRRPGRPGRRRRHDQVGLGRRPDRRGGEARVAEHGLRRHADRRRSREGSVDVKSASGDVRIGVKQGSRLFVDAKSLSGDTTSEVELGGVEVAAGGPLVEVKGATMSGDIRIVRA